MSSMLSAVVKIGNFCLRRSLGWEVKRSSNEIQRREEWLRSLGIRSVIDVGANEGQFARCILQILPQARVYSFEPLPECVSQLERLAQGKTNWRIFPYACGNSTATAQFHRSPFSASSSLLVMAERHKELFPFSAGDTVLQVQVRRLDDLLRNEDLTGPILVKLDVQGFEAQVIEGGRSVLSQASAVLTEVNFEPLYEQQSDFELTSQRLRECGLQFHGMWYQHLNEKTGCCVFGDALFTRSNQPVMERP